ASQSNPVQGGAVQGGAVQGGGLSGAPSASNQGPQEMPSLAPSPLITERRPTSSAFSGQASAEGSTQVSAQDRDPRALSDFRPSLDPYGSWVNHPSYGTVWIPSRSVVGAEFSPYVSAGHWALDDWGNWVWVSDYPFGRVVFHYGRWVMISGAGWAWVPGYQYAPAWVSWRVPTGAYAYVGWAPLGPSFLWFNGFAVGYSYGYYTPWVFCSSAYVFHPNVYRHVVRDRVLVDRLATSTRRYVPASPSVAGGPQRRYVSGPPPEVARVPARAVPRERLRPAPGTAPPAERSRFFSSSPRRAEGIERSRVQPDVRRFDTPRGLTPGRPAPSERAYIPRTRERAFEPGRSYTREPAAPRPRSFSPDRGGMPSRPSFSPPRSFSPSPSFSPPRSFSPSHGFSPGGGGGRAPASPRRR
ncbi:MAG TPA: DUF6600 domain-containing protein, partial [Polyangiaceae bacterium]|nr:DUF6600 domain-containing protein [Polyangiaceae bacterium]